MRINLIKEGDRLEIRSRPKVTTSDQNVKSNEILSQTLDNRNRCNRVLTHEACGVGRIGPDLVVDLDDALLDNDGDLTAGKGILETVAEEDGEREGLAQLVRTGRRTGSVSAAELVKHP